MISRLGVIKNTQMLLLWGLMVKDAEAELFPALKLSPHKTLEAKNTLAFGLTYIIAGKTQPPQ